MEQGQISIALIHGTFASDAPWTKETSTLQKVIEEELKHCGRTVTFSAPQWTARNSDKDRTQAAHDLVESLRKEWQDKNISKEARFLICHSHGGNVGIRAAAELQEELTGVVCLNTPFISVLKQPIVGRLIVVVMALIFILFGFSGNLIDAAGTFGSQVNAYFAIGAGVITWLVATGVLALLIPGLIYIARQVKVWGKEVEKWKGQELRRVVNRCPVLCIMSAGDEATYSLSFLETLVYFLAFAQNVFILFVFLGVAFVLQGLGLLPQVSIGSWDVNVLTFVGVFFISLLILSLVFPLLLRALGFDVGIRGLLESFASRVVVTPVPLNVRTVDFKDVEPKFPETTKDQPLWGRVLAWLLHCRIYEDEEIISLVAEWIANGGQFMKDDHATLTAEPARPTHMKQ